MNKSQRISIGLTNQEYRDLQNIAWKHEVSLAWIGRKAISDFLTKYRHTEHSPVLPIREAVKDK